MVTKRDLAIILPVYNPHQGWEGELLCALGKIQEIFSGVDYQITIVNDGSTDGVDDIIRNGILPEYPDIKYLCYPRNMGKGFAIRHAMERSASDYYIYCDFDFPFGTDVLRNIYEILAGGSTNLVMASRNFNTFIRRLPFIRRLVSLSLILINYCITGFRIKDTQAGLKGLDNRARSIFLTTKTNSFVFDLEFALKCLKSGIKFGFVKVDLNPEIRFNNFSSAILRRELVNFLKIIVGRV